MPETPDPNREPQGKYSLFRQIFVWVLVFVVVAHLGSLVSTSAQQEMPYSQFYAMLQNNETTGAIESVVQIDNRLEVTVREGDQTAEYYVYVPQGDEQLVQLLRTGVARYEVQPAQTFWGNLFYSMAPILVFILFLWYFVYRGSRQMGGPGGGIFSFGKVRARLADRNQDRVTFANVAGVDEAKEELQEIIAFLVDPKKFERLGGKIPRGVLLVGPPGTGKTLLARAVAGEAGVPFYSISGSDFVEMFVGVGASRVRDLFEQAKKASRASGKGCIIFIDEIDAVGRQRFAGIGGGHDEREQTLNQLLVEMDGFETGVGVIVMAATNRPDVLDPALLRPGRFDRHVVIDRPDIGGREAILNVHAKKIKLAAGVDLRYIARQTPGFSGADLANLCNEAALLAARRNKDDVGMEELEESIERVMAGPQRKSRVISRKEKQIVAVHESGHAFMSLVMKDTDPLHKVSIIPRGMAALGYTMQLPLQDRYLVSKSELFSRICVLLGGRIAEKLVFNEVSSGAHNDFEVATGLARRMVTEFGMTDRLGVLSLGRRNNPLFLGRELVEHKDYSEETARVIDEEIKRIIDDAYAHTESELKGGIDKLKTLSALLLEKEILDAAEVRNVLGFPQPPEQTAEDEEEGLVFAPTPRGDNGSQL